MKPKSISEAIVTYLSERPGQWHEVFFFEQKNICGKWTGVEARRRIREMFETEESTAEYKIGNISHSLERRKIGKYAEVRITGSKDTTPVYTLEYRDGRPVRVLQKV